MPKNMSRKLSIILPPPNIGQFRLCKCPFVGQFNFSANRNHEKIMQFHLGQDVNGTEQTITQ